MLTRVCTKCDIDENIDQFHKRKFNKSGITSWCKDCMQKYARERYLRLKSKILKASKKYDQNYADRRIIYMQKYRKINDEKIKRYSKKYFKEHRRESLAHVIKRRAALLQRIPKWLTPEQLQQIIGFYTNCPKGMEVDHIYPLQGKYVSGLHHPDNLQYLTKTQNRKKHNNCPEIDKYWE